MKTAVIYARYSSDNQTEQSIEGQLRVCEQFAKNNEILILNTYIDRAMTGTNDNRPAFQQMIKDSNKKEWDFVLVYKLDRFSRNKYEATIHKKTLRDNGVKLQSAMENIPDTPEGIILESLIEGMNQYYSAELAQKVKRGMRETRIKGYFQGGKIPYGYKLDGRKLIIDETASEIVQYMYNQYANGVYVSQIIRNLTNKGILYKGKPFATNTVYKILKRELYTGIYKKNDETYTNMFPQIIPQDLFDKVKAKQKTNHYGTRSVRKTYIFKNKLVCGYCGKPISAECGTSRNGNKSYYYKCLGVKKYHNGCPKETLRKEDFEEFLINSILTKLTTNTILEKLTINLLDLQKENAVQSASLNMLIKQKKQAENSLDNILNAIEQGVINRTTNKRMKELESQIEDLERQMIIERSKLNIMLSEKEIKDFYTQALEQEPLLLINYLIKEIKVYNDKIEITFNSPIIKNPNSKGSLFLSINSKLKQLMPNRLLVIYKDIRIDFYV